MTTAGVRPEELGPLLCQGVFTQILAESALLLDDKVILSLSDPAFVGSYLNSLVMRAQ